VRDKGSALDPKLQRQKTSSTGDREKEWGGGWLIKRKVRVTGNKRHEKARFPVADKQARPCNRGYDGDMIS
jgi:hypothetical protein